MSENGKGRRGMPHMPEPSRAIKADLRAKRRLLTRNDDAFVPAFLISPRLYPVIVITVTTITGVCRSVSEMCLPACMAKPRVLPLALRGTVGLSLGVPALHQQPAQCNEPQANCGLLPVVDKQRPEGHADPATPLEKVAHCRSVIDRRSTQPKRNDERHR